MFLRVLITVYEYFSGPITESNSPGSNRPLLNSFTSFVPPSPSGGNSGRPRSLRTGRSVGTLPISPSSKGKYKYFPSALQLPAHIVLQTTTRSPPAIG